jgi:hypothetical protein
MLYQWLANLLAIEKSTFMVICLLCSGGAMLLKSLLDEPLMSLVFYPVFVVLSLISYALLATFTVIPPTDNGVWMKSMAIAAFCGNLIGIIVVLAFANKAAADAERGSSAGGSGRKSRKSWKEASL